MKRNPLIPQTAATRSAIRWPALLICIGLSLAFLVGCTAPIGARNVTSRQAYAQVEANALRNDTLSASTSALLHRYDLDVMTEKQPDEAVRCLHRKALESNERDLLFALSEVSYFAANRIRREVKPWDRRDARDFYLGSAVYAWLFLFGDAQGPRPGPFDRRFRDACDLYNTSVGLAVLKDHSTNALAELVDGPRCLPIGDSRLVITNVNLHEPIGNFDRILLADRLTAHGLSVRNRETGIGAPLVCVRPRDAESGFRFCTPATMLLRGPTSLAALQPGMPPLTVELYSPFESSTIDVRGATVPLEMDTTIQSAYALNDSRVWKLGRWDFLVPPERIPNQLLMRRPYQPGRIPLVLVHGTFSSPVTWAEMANSLDADPVIRERYQVWAFLYGSGNPLMQSVVDLRSALSNRVKELDPEAKDPALQQMVVIGHSQGGLLTKGTAVNTHDDLWRVFSTNRVEDLKLSQAEEEDLRRYMFLEPLPFVKRVVFISTPHRGSYLAGGLARRLAARLVSLPGNIVSRSTDIMKFAGDSEGSRFLKGRMPTSLDGMSPKNPGLLVMAEIPVLPPIKAHSIIPVLGDGDYLKGKDGLVTYQSAHVGYVESEFILRAKHSCLNQPAAIEEVRRILHLHLDELK